MLRSENLIGVICINLIIISIWHLSICAICKSLNDDFLDYNKYSFKIKNIEDNGFFYSKRLKIKQWKDLLPQYISRDGFSKKKLDSLSLEYIDRFILETCRGEWAHKKCMLVSVLLLFINRFLVGFAFGGLVVFVNLPYVCIQRYNRIRLLRTRERLLQQDGRKSERLIGFVKRLDMADSQ